MTDEEAIKTAEQPEIIGRILAMLVDVTGEGFECAKRYMIRLEKEDFAKWVKPVFPQLPLEWWPTPDPGWIPR